MNNPQTQSSTPSAILDATACRRIDREVAKYPAEQKQSAVMAALAIAQDSHHDLSSDVIEAVADYLGMAPIAVHEVASFYNMYNTRPMGRFKLAVCTCLPCELRDGAKAGEYPEVSAGRRLQRNHAGRSVHAGRRANVWARAAMRRSCWSTISACAVS